MEPTVTQPSELQRRFPWITLLLGILAIASLIMAPNSEPSGYGGASFYLVVQLLRFAIPLVLVVSLALFLYGVVRYFIVTDAVKKHHSVILMISSIGAIVLGIGLLLFVQTLGATQVSLSPTGTMPASSPPYYGDSSTAVNDTREFNKVHYNAKMQTRRVQELTTRAETTVRGFGGRIDSTSNSNEYGFVRFVVPASKFQEFRAALESFVDARFLKVDVNSQNRLSDKLQIEASQESAQATLTAFKAQRQQLISSHTSAAKSLQSRIDTNQAEIDSLYAQPVSAQNEARIRVLENDTTFAQAALASENSSYKSSLAQMNENIRYAEESLASADDQNQDLLDDVATVNGSVSFRWINVWELAHAYLPGLWIPGIIAALAALSLWWERRRV